MTPRRALAALLAAVAAVTPPTASAQDVVFADGLEGFCAALGGGTDVANPQLLATLSDSFDEAWLGSPAVADLDNDGVNEIIAPRGNRLVVWHLPNTIVFQRSVASRIWASPVIGNFDVAIPGLEVAVAAGDSVHLWSANGTLLEGFPAVWRNELRALAGGDVDGNGDLELVAVTTTPLNANGRRDIVLALQHTGTTVAGFPPNTTFASGCDAVCYVTGGYDQNVGLGNVDADIALEILAPHDNAYMSLHDGNGVAFDAAPIFGPPSKFPGIRFLHDYAEAQQGFADDEATALQAHFTNSAPVFADVDADGTNELVILASVQNAAQTNRELGVALWAVRRDGTRPAAWLTPFRAPQYLAGLWDLGNNIVAATNQVAVVELDPLRAGKEFVFAGFDGRIHAVDSAAGAVWSYTYTTDPRVLTGGVAIADLSRDARPEIVFTTYSLDAGKGALIVLGPTGQLLRSVVLPDRGAMPVPTLADIDRNGTTEIVVSLKDGVTGVRQLLVYTVPGSADNCLYWPTGRGNLLRNGSVP